MKKFLLGMVSTFILIGLAVGGKYFYEYMIRPVETVVYGSAEELSLELGRLETIKEAGRLSWREKYKLGVSYHQSMRYNDAVLILEDFVKDKPEIGKAYETLGMSYFRLDKLSSAVDNWKIAKGFSNENSSSSSALDMMIKDVEKRIAINGRIKQLEGSLKKSEKDKEDVSDHWGEKFELALLYMGNKKYDEAIKYLEELSKIKNNDSDVHATLAQAYAMSGDFSKAYISMKTASTLSPDDEDLKKRLGELSRIDNGIKSGEFHKEDSTIKK